MKLDRSVLGGLILAVLVGTSALAASSLDAGTGRGISAASINQKLWAVEDNRLPEYLADRMIDGPSLNEAPLHGDWRSSDRPPLQTGMFLLVEPLLGAGDVGYQLHGIATQTWWVLALVGLLSVLGMSTWRRNVAVVLVATCGLVYLNTVYVRPGMLSAAIALITLAVLLSPEFRSPALASGLFAGLAYFAHGSTLIFFAAMLPLAWTAWRMRSRRPVAEIVIGVLVLAACVVPWTVFQSQYDPPGDRLTKYYLSGVTAASDQRSLPRAILDEYGELSPGAILENKANNVLAYVRGEPGVPGWYPRASLLDDLRWIQLFSFLGSLGLLLFGVTAALGEAREKQAVRASWVVAGVTMGLTAALHFGTWSTMPIPHKLGFSPVLIAGGLLAAAIARMPRWISHGLGALHVVAFTVIWVVLPHRDPLFDAPIPGVDLVAVTALVAAVVGVGVLLRFSENDELPPGHFPGTDELSPRGSTSTQAR